VNREHEGKGEATSELPVTGSELRLLLEQLRASKPGSIRSASTNPEFRNCARRIWVVDERGHRVERLEWKQDPGTAVLGADKRPALAGGARGRSQKPRTDTIVVPSELVPGGIPSVSAPFPSHFGSVLVCIDVCSPFFWSCRLLGQRRG
jgi:hypothetical protein